MSDPKDDESASRERILLESICSGGAQMHISHRHSLGVGLNLLFSMTSAPFVALLWILQQPIFAWFVRPDHVLRRIDCSIDWRPITEALEKNYKTGIGSILPICPIVLLRMLLVMVVYGISSERELVRRIEADLGARWFCKLGLSREAPSISSLSRFRGRLKPTGFQDVFVEALIQCADKNLIKLDMLLGDATRMPARSQRRSSKQVAVEVFNRLCEKLFGAEYVQPGDEEAEKDLNKLANVVCKATGYAKKKTARLLAAVRKCAEKTGKSIMILKGHLNQVAKCSKTALTEMVDGVLDSIPHGVGDTEARVGTLSKKGQFLGYIPTLFTDSAHGVVTSITVEPADTQPWTMLPELWKQNKDNLEKAGISRLPKAASLDSGFDYEPVHNLFREDGVTCYIAPRNVSAESKGISTDLFGFDSQGQVVCPQNLPMHEIARLKDGRRIYEGTGCENCSLRSKCTRREKRHIKISLERHRRRQEQIKETKGELHKKAMITRLQIERHIWHLTNRCQMRRCRQWGKANALIQCLLSATAHNMSLLAS